MGGIPGLEGSNPGKEVPEWWISPRIPICFVACLLVVACCLPACLLVAVVESKTAITPRTQTGIVGRTPARWKYRRVNSHSLGELLYNKAERATIRPSEKSCPVMLLACCMLLVVLLACVLAYLLLLLNYPTPKRDSNRIQKRDPLDERHRVGKIAVRSPMPWCILVLQPCRKGGVPSARYAVSRYVACLLLLLLVACLRACSSCC